MRKPRPGLRLLAAALLSAALTVPLATPASAEVHLGARIALPNGFQPEGIAIGNHKTAYLGSLANGDIYALNLRTGKGRVISKGPGTPSVGLKVDRRGLLYVAGGPTGSARVVSTKTGKILASYQLTTQPSFINDVTLTRSKAWFTDSFQAQLYSVPQARHGMVADPSKVVTLPLTGDWVQGDGFNANGIVSSPDRRSLLVIQSNTGFLFRVNPRTGVAKRVDLGGTLLPGGDGLLLTGRTLYVVQGGLSKVAVVKLNRAGTRGMLVNELTSPTFDIPTTIAASGKSLYLPNARFTTPPTPDTPYWVTRINRPGAGDDD